jgi:arsenate reductase
LLEQHNANLNVVLYLETPPSADDIAQLLGKLDLSVRDIIRNGESEYKDLGLSDKSLSDEQLLVAIAENPRLLQRPIVVKEDRAVIGRPPENVLELLK